MRTFFSCLLLCAAAAAQIPPCFGLNHTSANVVTAVTTFSSSGQNTLAWQITPSVPLNVQAAQVFTRNDSLSGNYFMILELWSDAGGLPGARLGGGTWRLVNSRPYAWQGAALDQIVPLAANVPVWLVWIEPGFSTLPQEPGGVTTPRAYRTASGPWTATTTGAPKLRLYCGIVGEWYSWEHGPSCAQSTGQSAALYANEVPTLGNTNYFLEATANPSGAPVFAVYGFPISPVPVSGFPAGCMQNVSIVAVSLLFAGTGTTRGPTCAGYVSVPLPIPANPSLLLTTLAAQAVPFDAGSAAPLPFTPSNGYCITLH